MTRVVVTARGFAVNGAAPGWGPFDGAHDPLVAAARAFVGARNHRLARLDRRALSALVAAHLALDDGAVPDSLFVAVAEGSEAADRAFWETARRRGGLEASPVLFAATLPSAVAGELAITFGLRGPCVVLAEAFDGPPSASAGVCGGLRLEVSLRGWADGADGEARATLLGPATASGIREGIPAPIR